MRAEDIRLDLWLTTALNFSTKRDGLSTTDLAEDVGPSVVDDSPGNLKRKTRR